MASSSKRRCCVNSPDNFCYICGKFTLVSQRRVITTSIKQAYNAYFGCHLGDQDKEWAPHICCISCSSALCKWMHHKDPKRMPFAVPMIWREPSNHATDCYFCLTNTSGHNRKTKDRIQYPDVPSAIKPVPHSADLPIPLPPTEEQFFQLSPAETPTSSTSSDNYIAPETEPHLISQEELNDLVRDLSLSKQHA
jgi:hypothetical protein